jgi:hypothetical protein
MIEEQSATTMKVKTIICISNACIDESGDYGENT